MEKFSSLFHGFKVHLISFSLSVTNYVTGEIPFLAVGHKLQSFFALQPTLELIKHSAAFSFLSFEANKNHFAEAS